MEKLRVGILGATGMVGQRFITLLADHPWFDITVLAASSQSAGKSYRDAVQNRWQMDVPCPSFEGDMTLMDAADVKSIAPLVDFVFCAVSLNKHDTLILEESYAKHEVPVVSNNSATRGIDDVPMIIPEINAHHLAVIPAQQKRLGTKRGFICVKPNCSIQSYVPALTPFLSLGINKVSVCTYQAISGAGKTFDTWPEMQDNLIPYIQGEEEKSEQEPLKIWGSLSQDRQAIQNNSDICISAQCLRVPVSNGHMAAVSVSFQQPISKEGILSAWAKYASPIDDLRLPSAPQPFLTYFEDPARPQTGLDRDLHRGMGISIGRLRKDHLFDYKFVCLSHNTLRGAAGGAVLTAELLCAKGYITRRNA